MAEPSDPAAPGPMLLEGVSKAISESGMRPVSAERLTELSAIAGKILPDGREVVISPMIFTFRMCIGAEGLSYFDEAYCYSTPEKAVAALMEWNGDGEPQGWHRHVNSGRRRPEGDCSREYVQK